MILYDLNRKNQILMRMRMHQKDLIHRWGYNQNKHKHSHHNKEFGLREVMQPTIM